MARLPLSVALSGVEHFQHLAERFQVGSRFALQRSVVVGIEIADYVIVPVLPDIVPGVLEQAELVSAIGVRSAGHQEPGAWTRRTPSRLAIIASR